MKTVTGALFLLLAEQAFAHSNMIQFPNHIYASEVLLPASLVSLLAGIFFLLWGLWADKASAGSAVVNTSSKSETEIPGRARQ